MEKNGMGWDGKERDGMEREGMGWDRKKSHTAPLKATSQPILVVMIYVGERWYIVTGTE